MSVKPLPEQRRRRTVTPKAREKFLEALAAGWSVTHAAARAGFTRQRFYEERDRDEAFRDQWEEAWEAGTDALEDELRRRSVDGYFEDTFDGDGNLTRRLLRYDNTGLHRALAARRPEKWRDNAPARVELNAQVQIEGHTPTPGEAVAALMGELGVLEQLGYVRADTIDGEATEQPLELPRGDGA